MLSKIYRACKEWRGWEGKGDFFMRMDITCQMLFKTIENGWKPGLGPNDKQYWMCCDAELDFDSAEYDAPF